MAISTSVQTVVRGTPTIPSTTPARSMKVANFNGVGGGTILYTGALPAHASVRLQGEDARRRGGRLADRLLDAGAVFRGERPHDGRRRPCRRSGVSRARAHLAAGAARQDRHAVRAGPQQARLALVAVRHRRRDEGVRWPRQVHQSRPLHAGLRARGEGERRHHLLAARAAGQGGAAHALPRARDHHQRAGLRLRRRLLRPERGGAVPARRGGDPGRQRHRHAAACCSTRPPPGFPTAWRTPRASWART